MNEVILVAQIRSKPGKYDRLKQELAALVVQTQLEKGCKQFDLYHAKDDPHLFVLWEYFVDRSAFDRHMNQSYTIAYFEIIKPSLTESTQVTKLNKILKP